VLETLRARDERIARLLEHFATTGWVSIDDLHKAYEGEAGS
jgi:hypothetical protein